MAMGILVAFSLAIAIVWATVAASRSAVAVDLRSWSAASDHVDLTFTVARRSSEPLNCVIRAQDRTRADVGYATVVVNPVGEVTAVRYALATIAPAYVVEVLGCSADGPPRVIEPQFPPRVVPPDQPWSGKPASRDSAATQGSG